MKVKVRTEIYPPRLEVVYRVPKNELATCKQDARARVRRFAAEVRSKGFRCSGWAEDMTVEEVSGGYGIEFFISPVIATHTVAVEKGLREAEAELERAATEDYYNIIVPALKSAGLAPQFKWRLIDDDWGLWDYNHDLYDNVEIWY